MNVSFWVMIKYRSFYRKTKNKVEQGKRDALSNTEWQNIGSRQLIAVFV